MNKSREYYEMLGSLGFGRPITKEEMDEYDQKRKEGTNVLNIISLNETFLVVDEAEIKETDFKKSATIKHLQLLTTIKNCLCFITGLVAVGIVLSIILALM